MKIYGQRIAIISYTKVFSIATYWNCMQHLTVTSNLKMCVKCTKHFIINYTLYTMYCTIKYSIVQRNKSVNVPIN